MDSIDSMGGQLITAIYTLIYIVLLPSSSFQLELHNLEDIHGSLQHIPAKAVPKAWLVSPSSPGQVTLPLQHVAPAASHVASVRSQTPPPCAPCAAYAPCQVPCQAHGCGACGRIRRVSNASTTGPTGPTCPACPACPAGPSGPSGPGVVSAVSILSSGSMPSMPRLQLGLGGLPPPPGISLSLKPDLPQLKQLGNPIPPVSPRGLQFPN